MEFHKDLISTLKRSKAKEVFVNEDGQWLFHSREGFESYTREEVLGEAAPEGEGAPKKGGKKGKNAGE